MDGIFPAVDPNKCLKTYGKVDRTSPKSSEVSKPAVFQLPTPLITLERKQLTTKNAVELLLEGTLKSKVCRYCLNVASQLSHLDQILEVAGKGTFYKVAIKDVIASFHPFKVAIDPNFPDKICENCLDRAISCYLFTQQCEQTERALRNCFEDLYDNLSKLDPLERTKKRGRHKLYPNYNKLYAEHEKVIDYADPIINIVNTSSEVLTDQTPISELECLKCCEILPNLGSLINHTRTHPTSMWYNCRLCGASFAKHHHIKKHFRLKHADNPNKEQNVMYACVRCGTAYEKCYDYLKHIEKHKFKVLMEHLVEKKMDRLCALCFNKGSMMTALDGTINIHGVCPELSGERSLYAILASTLPELALDSYTSTKICEKCVNNALTSYVFIMQSQFARNRLATCITAMLDTLNAITETENNICIEIATNAITNVHYDETVTEDDKTDIDVLEDEFRVESEDISETESIKNEPLESSVSVQNEPINDSQGNFKSTIHKTLNGYKYANEICSEFLTFRKKAKPKRRKFTCPVCNKHFISDYFLKRHCLKHLPRKVDCNICDLQFKSKFELYEHKKMTHILNNNMYSSCKICGRCYMEKEKLLHHEHHHRNPLCQMCDKKFVSHITYIHHIRRHMQKIAAIMKKYKQFCSFCEKDCSNDNEFSLHVNKVHLQIKPYGCDMCERHFYTEYNLRCHRRVHSVYSKEECEFCHKILYSRKRLVIHIRRHIGDMPFSCKICNQSFYSQFELNKHLTSHHGGRFCCKLCVNTFVTNKELKSHINKAHNMF